MIKKLIKKIIFNKIVARALLKILLKSHNFSYSFAGIFATILNNGTHPKHRIMKYKEWFLENIKKEWVVLDVGCNTGMMPSVMSQKASFVYGIEIDSRLLNKAKKEHQKENIEFFCADATSFDYSPLKPVDCVTLSNVLEHIEHRVEFLQKLINQIKWNDKKHFLIRVPMIDRDWITIYKKELGLEYRLDGTHFIEYTFKEFEDELKKAKIDIKKHEIRFGEIYAICEAL
ncbi:MAG: hypothetical protein QG567_532 [Campylobacterota bacterium]|nr:hypothetical protein [Campylobacterota bacterium]